MSIVLRLSACLLLTTALAACHKNESTAPTAAATTTPASASTAPATPAPTAAPTAAADDDAPVALDMDKVKAYLQAQKNLADAAQADPNLPDTAQNASEENTTQYAARLDANAKMHAAVAAAGLSTRDFARIGDTLIGAMMTNAALQAGQLKTIPDGIDKASVEFVKQHNAEIQAMFKQGVPSGT